MGGKTEQKQVRFKGQEFLKIDIVFPSLNIRNRLDLRVEK